MLTFDSVIFTDLLEKNGWWREKWLMNTFQR